MAALPLVLTAASAAAQVAPIPDPDNPRIQTIRYEPNMPVRLVAFPDASLTLLFHQGEKVERVVVSDGAAFDAAVVGASDAIEMAPKRAGAEAIMRVTTNWQDYSFELATGEGLAAAFLVRFVTDDQAPDTSQQLVAPGDAVWDYRISGKASVRPARVLDDGVKTLIEFGPDQPLPAVFGIGATGDEEIVAGYMRGGKFVIDRVYPELVFRIDKHRAKAQRLAQGATK